MKRMVVIVALSLMGWVFLPWAGLAQSKEDGIRLFKEAKELAQKARGATELQQVIARYEQSLKIFESLKLSKGVGDAAFEMGAVYERLRESAKALQWYQKALTVRKKAGDHSGAARVLLRMNLVFRSIRSNEKALECTQEALAIARSQNEVQLEAAALVDQGLCFEIMGRNSEALEHANMALSLARRINNRFIVGWALYVKGRVYRESGAPVPAQECLEESWTVMKEIGDLSGQAEVSNFLGAVYEDRGEYSKAFAAYSRLLEIARRQDNPNREAWALHNLGGIYWLTGREPKAIEHFQKAIVSARELNDPTLEAFAVNNLGAVLRDLGRYEEAEQYFLQVPALAVRTNDLRRTLWAWGNLALVSALWGKYPEAVDYYEKALHIAVEKGFRRDQAWLLGQVGSLYKNWGQYEKATEYLEQSQTIRAETSDKRGEAAGFVSLGGIYAHREEYDRALTMYQQGLRSYETIGAPSGWIQELIGELYLDMGDLNKAGPILKKLGYWPPLGRLCLLKGNYREAEDYFRKTLQAAEKSHRIDNLFVAWTGMGLAYEALGNDVAAEEAFKKAVGLTEELRSRLSRTERANFFDVKVRGFMRTVPYEGLARVLLRRNQPILALKTSESVKARSFAESIARRSSSQFGVPPQVIKKDAEIADRIAALKNRRDKSFEKGGHETSLSLESQIAEMEAVLADHVAMLRTEYPLFAATRYPQPMGLEETALLADEWVLSYHVTDTGIIAYLTCGKDLVKAGFKSVSKKELNELVRKFRDPLEMKAADNIMAKLKSFDFVTGKKLSDVLLAGILPALPKDARLIVVPDDCLGMLPFEMLPLNDGGSIVSDKEIPRVAGAEFLGDRNAVSYYQSITALTLARTYGRQKRSEGKLLVVADPIFQMRDARYQEPQKATRVAGAEASLYRDLMAAMEEGIFGNDALARLPLTLALAENLTKMYRGNAESLTGLEAGKERFLSQIAPSLTDYDKIVFATHGYFGKDLPGIQEPVLILSLVPPGTDGFLRMSEVTGLKMNADVVALTACQTGLGKKVSGEGTMGMGRAFQYAGARCVLMTLWSVSENASVDLVESFFKYVKEGRSRLESLRLARKELREKSYDHPFFWAPFILSGEVD